MKKIVLLTGMALGLCTSFRSEAQVRVNINIGAPVVQHGWYADDDDYYYMPEQGVYYNVRRGGYVYPEGGTWLYATQLPPRYGNYCYSNSHYHHVHARAPFYHNDYYRRQYGVAYRGGHGKHKHGNDRWRNSHDHGGHGNGYGNGHGNGHDRDWNNGPRSGGGGKHYSRN